MKVISLLQPWATLVVTGEKKIETRSWNTKYRGPILIHASAKWGKDQNRISCREPFYSILTKQGFVGGNTGHKCGLPLGAIIGQVTINDTLPTSYLLNKQFSLNIRGTEFMNRGISEQEKAFGDYAEGRYGWLLSDPGQFAQPIPTKGKLSIWDISLVMCDSCSWIGYEVDLIETDGFSDPEKTIAVCPDCGEHEFSYL